MAASRRGLDGSGGPAGVVSKKRGRTRNRKFTDAVRSDVVGLVRSLYPDFGPTLALEKLVERHGVDVSVETRRHYNEVRPHSSLDYLTPIEFKRTTTRTAGAISQ